MDTNALPLPQACLKRIVSFMTPRDISQLCLVSKSFRSFADSGDIWERFLLPAFQSFVPESFRNSSKKLQFLALCDHPVLIDSGRKSFSLDKHTGKTCIMLSARELAITWSADPKYWIWFSCPDDSRFGEAVQLSQVHWLDIKGEINAQVLSEETAYTAFLVYKLRPDAKAFEYPMEVEARLVGSDYPKRSVYLKIGETADRKIVGFFQRKQTLFSVLKDNAFSQLRKDGWLEAELGRFMVERGTDVDVTMMLREIKSGQCKSGLIVQGIEIRPRAAPLIPIKLPNI